MGVICPDGCYLFQDSQYLCSESIRAHLQYWQYCDNDESYATVSALLEICVSVTEGVLRAKFGPN